MTVRPQNPRHPARAPVSRIQSFLIPTTFAGGGKLGLFFQTRQYEFCLFRVSYFEFPARGRRLAHSTTLRTCFELALFFQAPKAVLST